MLWILPGKRGSVLSLEHNIHCLLNNAQHELLEVIQQKLNVHRTYYMNICSTGKSKIKVGKPCFGI
jgi:endonuclease IV